MANEVEIPLKLSGVTSLKAELRSLKVAIAEASDPEQMAALAAKAGEVADRIKDANEQVAVFTTGSKFEAVSNSFSMIGNDLASLDFEGAAEKAQTFSKTLGSLNAADVSKGLKGLTSTVGTMSKAFLKFGLQLLTNPIFLLAVVIAAIVVAVGIFLNKIGVLEKVLYLAFLPLNLLIEGFQKLTDWLGLTSHAAEENARTMEKSNEKAFKSSEKRTEAISDGYDIEIAKAKAAGKDTTQLELDKSKAITDAAKKRLGDARSEYAQLKGLTDKDSIERRKALRKRIEDENKLIKDGSKERKMIQIADDAEQKAADDKAAEEAKQKREERLKKYKEGEAAILAEIKSANKLVVDSTKTQSQKEIDDIKTKYAALIEEAKKYKKDITSLEAARETEIAAINKEAADKELERQKSLAKQLSDFKNAELDREEAIQEAIYQAGLTARQKELEERTYYYDNLIAEANRYGLDTTVLQEQQRKDLADVNKKFDDQEKQAALDKISQEKAVRDAKIEIANSIATGLGAIGEAFIKDQKKLEQFNKAQALIQIGIDTAKAISSLVAMSSANPLNSVTGGAAGIAQYAAGIVQIVTNIAKAKALLTNPSSTPSTNSTPTGSGGGGTSMSSSVPSFVPGNLFGQGNAANNTGSASGVETNSTITVNAVVSETEMTGVQNKVNKILKNAVL